MKLIKNYLLISKDRINKKGGLINKFELWNIQKSAYYDFDDLTQIGSHNKCEKKTYKSNPNIKLELAKNLFFLISFSLVKVFFMKSL